MMRAIGDFIQWATNVQPFLMGIIIAVVMGMALTAPISSAAIAISISLGGIAGGAAVVGCCVQMLGFAVMSRKDNNIGTVISVGIGTSMLQFKNILKKPIIWLPTIIVSAILAARHDRLQDDVRPVRKRNGHFRPRRPVRHLRGHGRGKGFLAEPDVA